LPRGAELDVVVVGAGFAGLYAVHRFRNAGLSVRVFERGSGVGGTWYWNRYPGARCDIESMEYSYQFSEELQQEWEWTERYASQPEILAYMEHVADRFDLRRDIQFDSKVTAAEFDEASDRWRVRTEDGGLVVARYLILATGPLSLANTPDFPGLDTFAGETYHTGDWPAEGVDFTGKRVGVIGTGSSGIQSIPLIAEQADHLHVFQRTPNYSMPARNHPLDPELQADVKDDYAGFRARQAQKHGGAGAHWPVPGGSALDRTPEERRAGFEASWEYGGLCFLSTFEDIGASDEANQNAADFVRDRIRETVKDPEVAELLCPEQQIGCKRPCADTSYYETFNRPNVTLVDVSKDPVDRMTPSGVVVAEREYALDCIVFATGFDAMTGSIVAIDIRGREGRSLREKWAEGPSNYLGLGTHGFPNLFTVTGPGSPSVLANMVPGSEHHVDWIADCIVHLGDRGLTRIEPERAAEEAWVDHVNEISDGTRFPSCNSWYLGSNIPGKKRIFMPYAGGFPVYVAKCEEVAAKGYEGFSLS